MIIWAIIISSVILSLLLTGLLRRYALSNSLMDIPNQRSSHTVPTPRGGGVAIVVVFLTGLSCLWTMSLLDDKAFVAFIVAGLWVAIIGFIDDHNHIAARWRLLAHFCAAGWLLLWLGGLPPLIMSGTEINLGWAGHLLVLVYLVWLLNLYNFMDGIDGIAGIEAVTVCLGGAVLYNLSEVSGSEWQLPLVLMAAVIGFLFWNFPKARIFMGDAGSGVIGLVLGGFTIQAAWVSPELFWGWVILLAAFIVDATITLLRRIVRGDKFYQAHRSHAYQHASRKIGAHLPVSLAFGAINLFWLLPVAALVTIGWIGGAVGLVIACTPLVWLAFAFKAGAIEE